MANPIIRGFRKLTQFSGRDTRGEFWPYAGVVFALVMVLGGMAGAALMSRFLTEAGSYGSTYGTQVAPLTPSEPVLIEAVNPAPPALATFPDLIPFFIAQGATVVLIVILLAAAVSRRLHDRNMPGWWGLAPLPFVTFGVIVFQVMYRDFTSGADEPDFTLFGLLFLNNIIYLTTLIGLIVMLALKGTRGPNRYGPASVAEDEPRPVSDWDSPS